MNTPTPKTDAELIKDAEDSWKHRDTLRADKLERELSDMTARAEAAEAALAEMNKELYPALDAKTESRFYYQGVIRMAIAVDAAETRFVIAGLREEVAQLREAFNLVKTLNPIMPTDMPPINSARACIAYVTAERNQLDALRARVADLERELAESDAGLKQVGPALERAWKAEAHRDALISAGNAVKKNYEALRKVCITHKEPSQSVSNWDAAVSGAQAGAKGADELATLLDYKETFDWWMNQNAPDIGVMNPLNDDPNRSPIYWVYGYKEAGEHRSIIEAIKAARKASA